MANCTGTTTYEEWHLVWTWVKVVTIVLSIIPLSLSLSLAAYMCLKKNRPDKSSTERKDAAAINALCFIAAVLAFMRVGVDLELILGNDSNAECTASMMAKNIFYISAVGVMYLILWLRQRVFYYHAALKHLRTTAVRVFSWCTLLFVTGGSILMMILYVTTASYVLTECGCVRLDDSSVLKYMGGLFGNVVSQGTLLALLSYPLLKRRKIGIENRWRTAQSNSARSFVKRACFAAVICILTDSISSIAGIVYGPYEAYKLVFELNLVINLVSVVCSFPDWKDRFFPCLMKRARAELEKSCRISAFRPIVIKPANGRNTVVINVLSHPEKNLERFCEPSRSPGTPIRNGT